MRIRPALSALILVFSALLLSAQAQQVFAPTVASVATVSVADLFSSKKDSLIGQPITLRNVQVQDKTGRDAIWVGPSLQQMVLVTMPSIVRPLYSDGRDAKLNKGDLVTVNGVVQRAPLAFQLHDGWGVDRTQAEALGENGVIINGLRVEVAQSARQ
jgi:hypothetical protein